MANEDINLNLTFLVVFYSKVGNFLELIYRMVTGCTTDKPGRISMTLKVVLISVNWFQIIIVIKSMNFGEHSFVEYVNDSNIGCKFN